MAKREIERLNRDGPISDYPLRSTVISNYERIELNAELLVSDDA
ncbi:MULTISPECIES: hypothetical protein [Methylotuvimicrobium]|nr:MULTISPECIES: hypothetical protein [Methylotuvimicrobium]